MSEDGTGCKQPVENPVVGTYGTVILLLTGLGNVRSGGLDTPVKVAIEIDRQLAEGTAVIAVESVAGLQILLLMVLTHQPVVKAAVGINITDGVGDIPVFSWKGGQGVLHPCLLFGRELVVDAAHNSKGVGETIHTELVLLCPEGVHIGALPDDALLQVGIPLILEGAEEIPPVVMVVHVELLPQIGVFCLQVGGAEVKPGKRDLYKGIDLIFSIERKMTLPVGNGTGNQHRVRHSIECHVGKRDGVAFTVDYCTVYLCMHGQKYATKKKK